MIAFTGDTIKTKSSKWPTILESIESEYKVGDLVAYMPMGLEEEQKYKVVDIVWYQGLKQFAYWLKPVRHKCEIGSDVPEDELAPWLIDVKRKR